jgi:hypothetical protein
MRNPFRKPARRSCTRALQALCLVAAAGVLIFTATVGQAEADRYDPTRAGNPIRISAYILHPVGVLLDYGLMRPCFWVVQHEPFSTIFGYEHTRKDDLPERQK